MMGNSRDKKNENERVRRHSTGTGRYLPFREMVYTSDSSVMMRTGKAVGDVTKRP